MFQKLFNFRDQIFNTFKSSPAEGFLGNKIKPDFDLIEPRGLSGNGVNLVTGTGGEPTLNLSVLMGPIIIDYQMNV